MSVEFEDYTIQVIAALDDGVEEFLYTAGEIIKGQAGQISPVDTGQLRGSWDYKVDLGEKKVQIGSPLENAIWNELGTGEYADNGDGRKGGWRYEDDSGEWHFTRGKKPRRTLQKSFTAKRSSIDNLAKRIFGERMN